jgi:hypothetical protein
MFYLSFFSSFCQLLSFLFYSGRCYLAGLRKKESWASQEFGVAKSGSQIFFRKRLNFAKNNLNISWKL